MIRAVIDTNVLVSALISPSGNEALVVLGVQEDLIVACFSEEILQEYAEVLSRPKFSFHHNEIVSLLHLLRRKGDELKIESLPTSLIDLDDEKFVACAISASADFIVTGNKRHFPREACGQIEVVDASELLDRMTLDRSW